MADAVVSADEFALLREVFMAGQNPAGAAAPPIGRWTAPSLPFGVGELQAGTTGTWMLSFGPPWVAGGPPRTMWVDGQRL
eukprot:15446151-Alexandrium_andersonii.AAC.1